MLSYRMHNSHWRIKTPSTASWTEKRTKRKLDNLKLINSGKILLIFSKNISTLLQYSVYLHSDWLTYLTSMSSEIAGREKSYYLICSSIHPKTNKRLNKKQKPRGIPSWFLLDLSTRGKLPTEISSFPSINIKLND